MQITQLSSETLSNKEYNTYFNLVFFHLCHINEKNTP